MGIQTQTRMCQVRVPSTFGGVYKLLFQESEWSRQKKRGHPIYSPLFVTQSSVFLQDSFGLGLVGGGSKSKLALTQLGGLGPGKTSSKIVVCTISLIEVTVGVILAAPTRVNWKNISAHGNLTVGFS